MFIITHVHICYPWQMNTVKCYLPHKIVDVEVQNSEKSIDSSAGADPCSTVH